jgi:hypothetical protein
MHTVPYINGKSCKPYIEIISVKNFSKIYTGKHDDNLVTFKYPTVEDNKYDSDWHSIPQQKDQLMAGDILIKIMHQGSFSNTPI